MRQHDNSGKIIHDWEKMIEYASTAWTLEPGDVVRMEVEGIGYLENRVVPEPPGTMGFIG